VRRATVTVGLGWVGVGLPPPPVDFDPQEAVNTHAARIWTFLVRICIWSPDCVAEAGGLEDALFIGVGESPEQVAEIE
jgi:hypothetical protein